MYNGLYYGSYFGEYYGRSTAPPAPVTQYGGGGFYTEEEYKRYLKYIEQLQKAAKTKIITEDIIEAAQELIEIPVELQTINAIANENKFDYSRIENDIKLITEYFDNLINAAKKYEIMMREVDDEEVLMVLM